MSKETPFRRSRADKPKTATAQEIQIAEAGADQPTEPQQPKPRQRKKAEPTKDFGTPLTELERDLLEEVAGIADQSARKMARRLLVKAMQEFIAEHEH